MVRGLDDMLKSYKMGFMLVKIRFNTEVLKTPELQPPEWRVLYEGCEHFAREVSIEVPCWTTQDVLPEGVTKWHFSCEGKPEWDGEKLRIT